MSICVSRHRDREEKSIIRSLKVGSGVNGTDSEGYLHLAFEDIGYLFILLFVPTPLDMLQAIFFSLFKTVKTVKSAL
jgi:hypothetical protein